MKNINCVFLLILILTNCVFSQSTIWSKTFDNGEAEKGQSIRVDASGNTFVSGIRWDGVNAYPFMLKYSAGGVLLNQHLGHFRMNYDKKAILIDGGFNTYCLNTSSPGFMLTRYGSDLLNRWVITGPSRVNSRFSAAGIIVRTGGGVFVFGSVRDTITNIKSSFVSAFSSTGIHNWSRYYSSISGPTPSLMVQTDDGSIYLTGIQNDSANVFYDIFILKYSSNGTFQWVNNFIRGGDDSPAVIQKDGNGVIIGGTEGFLAGNFSDIEPHVIRIRPDGTIAYDVALPYTWRAGITAIAEGTSHNCYVVYNDSEREMFSPLQQYEHIRFTKLDGSGNTIYNSTHSQNSETFEHANTLLKIGSEYYIAGSVIDSGHTAYKNLQLLHYNTNGFTWELKGNDSANYYNEILAIAVTTNGVVFTGTKFNTDRDAVTEFVSNTNISCNSNQTRMCYQGSSICVLNSQVSNYLILGAIPGSCTSLRQGEEKSDIDWESTQPFPNPTSDQFHFQSPTPVSGEIFDLTGKLIDRFEGEAGEVSFGGELRSGVYFLRLQNKLNAIRTVRIVKY